jgi:hypothetical protein
MVSFTWGMGSFGVGGQPLMLREFQVMITRKRSAGLELPDPDVPECARRALEPWAPTADSPGPTPKRGDPGHR